MTILKIYKIPKFYQSIYYLFKTFKSWFKKKIFNNLLSRKLRWNICYQFTENWNAPLIKNSIIIKIQK